MATTTNYGWTTPDDTALVKDGASAIRTLGSSVDTSVKALSPGTTAGDLDYYTSSTAKARIGIGTNGQVLTSNGSVPSWTTPTSGSLTLLSTTTLSGTSTTVSGISGSYNNLLILAHGLNQTVTTYNFRINPNASTSIVDMSGTVQSSSTGTSGFYNATIDHADGIKANDTTNAFELEIYNYASTTANKTFRYTGVFRTTSGVPNYTVNYGGGIRTTSAITSLVFTSSQGTNAYTAGTVLIYGVK